MNATTERKISLNVPNDYNSEADNIAAIEDCYDGDTVACENHLGQEMFDKLSSVAETAGLEYVGDTDFGTTWIGTDAQFAKCVELLPGWAKGYVSICED